MAALAMISASCSKAATPSAADFAASSSANEGAFKAFDEACTGTGDLSESLARAKKEDWVEFTPPENEMLDDYKKMLLSGPIFDRPEVVLLRKTSNRAEVIMWENRTLTQSDYIFQCEVIERNAGGLDRPALENWAKVPIESRQIDDSPEYLDLRGGRFANGLGGKATAYFVSERGPHQLLTGLEISIARSSFADKGTQ